jgi:FLVCR family feline leukemia virus subgroup C receptor-related protein
MGGALNLVGALTRVLPWPFVGGAVTGVSFAFAMLGQFLASVAQTFILATPPKVARNWFPPSEVVTATSVGALCNQAGIAIGFYLSPLVLQEQASRMPFVMLVEAAVAAAALVLVVAFFRSDPHDEAPLAARTPAASPRAHVAQPQPDHPQPPAASLAPSRPSAAPQLASQAPVGLRTLRALLTDPHNRHFLVLTFSYGLGVGVFYAISTLMGQALDVVHYSASDSGLLGVVLVLGGLAGSVTAGAIADRVPDKKRKVLLLSLWASAFSLVWYSLENRSDNLSRLLAVCAVMGFFMTAVIPVGLDVGVEATFPVPETASSTTLLLSAQLFGIALITALSFVPAGRVFLHTVNWALTGGGVVAAGVLFFFRAEYRRSLYEHEHYAAAP